MTMNEQARQERIAKAYWRTMQASIRPLLAFECPTIRINNRLWRTAGQCYQEERIVELAGKFLRFSLAYRREMESTIIRHELIHVADFDLHGPSDMRCGHGSEWVKLMEAMGECPNPYHEMEITR